MTCGSLWGPRGSQAPDSQLYHQLDSRPPGTAWGGSGLPSRAPAWGVTQRPFRSHVGPVRPHSCPQAMAEGHTSTPSGSGLPALPHLTSRWGCPLPGRRPHPNLARIAQVLISEFQTEPRTRTYPHPHRHGGSARSIPPESRYTQTGSALPVYRAALQQAPRPAQPTHPGPCPGSTTSSRCQVRTPLGKGMVSFRPKHFNE